MEVNGHMREGRWRPVVALLTMLWWLLPLHCTTSQHHIASLSSLVGPPLPVITGMYQPPYEQLLVVEGSGAMGVVISPLSLSSSCPVLPVLVPHWCWCHCHRCLLPSLPSLFLLIVIVEMVTGPLAPVPPCEQGLAVVGGGCWAAVSSSSSLRAWHKSRAAPMIHPTSSFS